VAESAAAALDDMFVYIVACIKAKPVQTRAEPHASRTANKAALPHHACGLMPHLLENA